MGKLNDEKKIMSASFDLLHTKMVNKETLKK
jgi:hypothetical protein